MTTPAHTESEGKERGAWQLYTLRRSGLRPLVFHGRSLIEMMQPGPLKVHLMLLETEDGDYVACLSHARRPKSEILTHQARRFDTADQAMDFLCQARPGVSLGMHIAVVQSQGRESARKARDSLSRNVESCRMSYLRFLQLIISDERLKMAGS